MTGGMQAGQSQGGSHVGRCMAHLECDVKTLITPPSTCRALGRVESELVGLFVKALSQDATRRLLFIVHTAGWLHSLVLRGHCAGVNDRF